MFRNSIAQVAKLLEEHTWSLGKIIDLADLEGATEAGDVRKEVSRSTGHLKDRMEVNADRYSKDRMRSPQWWYQRRRLSISIRGAA